MKLDLQKLYEKYSAGEQQRQNRDDIAWLYSTLTPENRDTVSLMIEFLLDRQSSDPR